MHAYILEASIIATVTLLGFLSLTAYFMDMGKDNLSSYVSVTSTMSSIITGGISIVMLVLLAVKVAVIGVEM